MNKTDSILPACWKPMASVPLGETVDLLEGYDVHYGYKWFEGRWCRTSVDQAGESVVAVVNAPNRWRKSAEEFSDQLIWTFGVSELNTHSLVVGSAQTKIGAYRLTSTQDKMTLTCDNTFILGYHISERNVKERLLTAAQNHYSARVKGVRCVPEPEPAPDEPKYVTLEVLVDALSCFWNAALDVSHGSGDGTTVSTVSAITQGVDAVTRRLQEELEK